MIVKSKLASFVIVLAILFSGLIFAFLTNINPKISIALSFLFFLAPLILLFFNKINIKTAVLFYIFLYPLLPCLAGFQIASGIPVFKTQRMLTMALICLLITKGLFFDYYRNFYSSNLFTIWIFLISLSYLFTIILSTSKVSTLNLFLSFHLESIIISVVIFEVFVDRSSLEKLTSVLTYSLLIICFLGIIERITQYNFFTIFGVFDQNLSSTLSFKMRGGEIRIQGPFDHSIAFSAYLVTVLPIALYRFRRNKIMCIILLFFVLINVLFSQSRVGLLGYLIALFLIFITRSKKSFIFGIIFGFILVIPNFDKIYKKFIESDSSSSSERIMQVQYLMGYIKKKFIFGYGQAPFLGRMRGTMTGAAGNYQTTIDNYYLLYTYQWGFLGLILYLLFFSSVFYQSIKKVGKNLVKNQLLIMILIGLVVFAIIDIVVALWSFHFVFWIYLGIIARLIMIDKEERNAFNYNS